MDVITLDEARKAKECCGSRSGCNACPADSGGYCVADIDALVATLEENEKLRSELAEWERVKALFREEDKHKGQTRDNPYHSHAHSVLGIWDSDNGPLAGHECAACAAARVALKE